VHDGAILRSKCGQLVEADRGKGGRCNGYGHGLLTQVFRFSDVPGPDQRFLAEAGVTAYCSVSQAAPPQGLSQTHAPEVQAPFSEPGEGVRCQQRCPRQAAVGGGWWVVSGGA
jgi:hypothetical protein